jgi:hypothetical protein
MNMLDRLLNVDFLMPASKENDRVKEAGNRGLPQTITWFQRKMVKKFKIRNSKKEEEASFRLMIYRKKKNSKERQIRFPINTSPSLPTWNIHSKARKLYRKIPLEYKMRWGIETGFRMKNTVKAMKTSQPELHYQDDDISIGCFQY